MELCTLEHPWQFQFEGSCTSCPRNALPSSGASMTLEQIVPHGLCPFAYFSIVPYWLSLSSGAWFPWRKDKNDVVCQCARPKGVVFVVRRVVGSGECLIEAEVVGVGDSCPYGHRIGDTFLISSPVCPAMFPSLWCQIDQLVESKSSIEIGCAICPSGVRVRANSRKAANSAE